MLLYQSTLATLAIEEQTMASPKYLRTVNLEIDASKAIYFKAVSHITGLSWRTGTGQKNNYPVVRRPVR